MSLSGNPRPCRSRVARSASSALSNDPIMVLIMEASIASAGHGPFRPQLAKLMNDDRRSCRSSVIGGPRCGCRTTSQTASYSLNSLEPRGVIRRLVPNRANLALLFPQPARLFRCRYRQSAMAYHSDVQRITRALNWIGAGALGFGILVVVWALWWTRGVDDFRTAVIVAALGFGLPSLVALTLAWLLDPLLESESAAAIPAPATPVEKRTGLRFGFYDWPAAFRYLAALVAVGLSAVLRMWLHPVLGDSVPFITFFLGVALAAWIGGFGPSVFAVAMA